MTLMIALRPAARAALLLATFAAPAALQAQKTQTVAVSAAPIPAQILSSKRAFISNAGTDAAAHSKLANDSLDVNATYNEFYAAMSEWKRYELVSTPGQADLVLEISFTAPISDCGKEDCEGPQVTLVVYDASSHFRLWTITEPVQGALLQSNWKTNFATAVKTVADDLKELTIPKS